MAPQLLHGRTAKTVTAQHANQSNSAVSAVYPLAQTLPSVALQPRFRAPQMSPVPKPYQAPNQSPQWRGGDNTNDRLIHRDREPQFSRGTEVAGRISSMPDPPKDGPIRAGLRLINRTWNYQVGMGTAYADDLSRPYSRVGEKGTPWVAIYGGTPGFYRQGPGGPPIGNPEEGPGRVTSGPPHGYHTYYPPDRQQTLTNYRARPQMIAPRVDRLSNSRIAGQNYSQWTKHQGGGQQ